eukprot:TRINITY_DN1035_c0_g1_i1.p1 TRINITY_DN1035_c0_g1~~TRINITY_DN1035_c0_g1_i1.p1  ORF type:complete len:268 (-),score=38.34 TRINITY_DN1035_c0_g1_i1:980-1783(-)
MALRVSEEFEQFVVRQPSDVRKWKKTVKAFRTYAWTTANQHGVDRGVFWSLISFVGFLIEDTFSVHLKSLAYFHRDLRAHCQKCNWEKVDNCVNFELLDLPVRPWNITFYAEEMVNDYVGLAGRRVGVNHDCKKCKANNSVIRMFRMMTMPKLLIIFIDVDGGRLDTPRYIHIRPTWHNGHEYKYELLTVFVHTGGHYVVYMHLKKPLSKVFSITTIWSTEEELHLLRKLGFQEAPQITVQSVPCTFSPNTNRSKTRMSMKFLDLLQ